MPFIESIIDLGVIPVWRNGPVDDDISTALQEGLILEETEGVEFAVGRAAQRRGVLRDRARTRGLKQSSRSYLDAQGRRILLVQWYRKQRGDLRVTQPTTRAAGRA